jgi:hypothetical protein
MPRLANGIARGLYPPHTSDSMIIFPATAKGSMRCPGGKRGMAGFRMSFRTTFRCFAWQYGTSRSGSLVDHPDYLGAKNGGFRDYPARVTLFGITLLTQYPSRARDIAADDPRRYEGPAYRIDMRGPGVMMVAGEFSGMGTDDDIKNHVHYGIGAHYASRLCSWSKKPIGTQVVGRIFRRVTPDVPLFTYEAKLFRHNTFDTRKDTLLRAISMNQKEVVCSRTSLRDVVAVTLPATADGGPWKVLYPFWPRSELSIERSVTKPDPFLPDLSGG